ncbi:MAG: four helix bundle protein [Patescibacteria group bacterium]
MSQIINNKFYDLEERTFKFAQDIIRYVRGLPKTVSNIEIGKQLIRSGCSVGANYIEANESLGKKDFFMRIRICKKEAKESRYWLKLSEPNVSQLKEKGRLIQETNELMKIYGSIAEKAKSLKH